MAKITEEKAKKLIEEAKSEAWQELGELVKSSRSATDALDIARRDAGLMEIELGRRTIPYGADYWSKRGKHKQRYYADDSGDILNVKWKVYKEFIEQLEREMVPKTRHEELVMYDKGHTLEELQKMCRDRGLTISGSKKELIARLV